MKRNVKNIVLSILLICIATGLSSCSEDMSQTEKIAVQFFKSYKDDAYRISPEDFIYQARSNPDLFTIDLRDPVMYAQGHIKYALNIPWGMDLWANIDKIPTDKPVTVYADSEDVSMQATALLALAGFQVKSVIAGWDDGIALVENIDSILETSPNRFNQVPPPNIDPDLRASIEQYFKDMAMFTYSMMDDFTVYHEDAVFMFKNKEEDKAFLCIDPINTDSSEFSVGSVNIPFGPEMYKSFNDLPEDQYILVYGTNRQETAFATVWLRLFGYDAVLVQSQTLNNPLKGDEGQ